MNVLFLNKGKLETVSGGYIFNREIIDFGRRKGFNVNYSSQFLDHHYDCIIVDSLMFNESDIFRAVDLKKTVALVHQLPSAKESYMMREMNVAERNAIKYVVTGQSTKKDLMDKWQINPNNISTILPGVYDHWKKKESWSAEIKSLIIVANYLPGKGYDALIKLVPKIYDLNLSLKCFGNMKLDAAYSHKIKHEIRKIDPDNRIRLHDTIDPVLLNEELIHSDLFLSLSTSESYGMAIKEALSSNVPVLMYKTGQWEEFMETGLTKVIENGNMEEFQENLRNIVEGKAEFDYPKGQKNKVRSWNEVGEEFFNHCENWMSF